MHRIRCSILSVMLAVALTAGCASSSRSVDSSSSSSASPESILYEHAGREAMRRDLPPMAVPPPPGVEPELLMGNDAADQVIAAMPLSEALRALSSGTDKNAGADAAADAADAVELDAESEADALRHYIRGRDAALAERHLVAITEFNRVLEIDPSSAEALRALARSHMAMGNPMRASQHYARLAQVKPDDSEAVLATARAAASRRDLDRAAAILARRHLDAQVFDHDQFAPLLADITLASVLRQLGYDRAFIELAQSLGPPPVHLLDQTMYGAELTMMYRDQAATWQAVGDAHCRLGEYEHALEAYAVAGRLASADASSLHPRVIYANLRLGRTATVQVETLAALKSRETISDRDVRLCEYVTAHLPEVDRLAAAVIDMYQLAPDQPDLARAAAALLPEASAMQTLREFVDRRPRDLRVVGQLLEWVLSRDEATAVALTAGLIENHPDLAGEYIGRLFFASPQPDQLVGAVDALDESAVTANIRVRAMGLLGDIGEAWHALQQARDLWPDDEPLFLLELDLLGLLEEPMLAAASLAAAESFDSTGAWMARARLHRALDQHEDAVAAAERAVDLAEGSQQEAGALLELAAASAGFAGDQEDARDRNRWASEAAGMARMVLEIDPSADGAYELLLALHGGNGLLPDQNAVRTIARQLFETDPDSRLYARLAAEEAMGLGRYEQALERLLNLYDSDQSDTRALRLAISAWVRLDRVDAAMQWLNQRIEARPGDPALLEAWVELMLRQDRAAEAVAILTPMTEPDETGSTSARRLLESILRATGQLERAFELGQQRLLARPQGVRREVELAALYGGAGMHEQAVQRLVWVDEHVEFATADHLATAVAILGRIEGDAARINDLTARFVRVGIERRASWPLQFYGTGLRALARQGRLDTAFDDMALAAAGSAQSASGPSPHHAMVWRELAQALVDDGLAGAAARALKVRVVCDVPLEPDALNLLTNMAIVADAASTTLPPAQLTIDMVNELASQGRPPLLLGMDDQQPTIAEVLYQASQMFSLLGNDAGAEQLLRRVLDEQPDNGMALNNLGYMRIEAGHDDEQTIAWIERAAEVERDQASVMDTLGWLRYKQGVLDDETGAKGLIMRSLNTSDEPSAEVLDHLGDVYWRLGETEAAVEAWREAAAMLSEPQQQRQIQTNLLRLQTHGWGLLVADPADLYNREYGARMRRLQEKLDAVDQGLQPPVAATFAEQ